MTKLFKVQHFPTPRGRIPSNFFEVEAQSCDDAAVICVQYRKEIGVRVSDVIVVKDLETGHLAEYKIILNKMGTKPLFIGNPPAS